MISKTYVPATGSEKSSLYIIGEAPGETEEISGIPFSGIAGQELDSMLMRKGIRRENCYISNLCHYRPKDNKFNYLLNSPQLRDGLAELENTILSNYPNLVVLLGVNCLEHLLKVKSPSIRAYRGSILSLVGVKCIPTFHPAYIKRHTTNPIDIAIWDMDWDRIALDKDFPELNYPKYQFLVNPSWKIVREYCASSYLSVDIESIRDTSEILCVGFARSDTEAICIEYDRSLVSNTEKIDALLNSSANKIFQNGIFDLCQLEDNGHEVKNYTEDTIIQAHVLDPELPRDLGYLASIHTRQPYYKKSGRSNIPLDQKGWSNKARENKAGLYNYNCTDCCVTYRVWEEQKKELDKEENFYLKETYEWEILSQRMAISISRAGILVDEDRRLELEKEAEIDWLHKQLLLEGLVQHKINVRSYKQMIELLYKKLGLPEKYNGRGDERKLTTDDSAIISLLGYTKQHIEDVKKSSTKKEWEIKFYILKLTHEIRGLLKKKSNYIDLKVSEDGRLRGTHKVHGTETGRWGVSEYVDGTGLSLPTIPRD